jgi:hypothetical protein
MLSFHHQEGQLLVLARRTHTEEVAWAFIEDSSSVGLPDTGIEAVSVSSDTSVIAIQCRHSTTRRIMV